MSKGLGRVEQQVLEGLKPTRHEAHPARTAHQIASMIAAGKLYGVSVRQMPPGLRESVYRAIRSLVRKELVCKDPKVWPGERGEGTATARARWMLAGVARAEADADRKREQREAAKRRKAEEAYAREHPGDAARDRRWDAVYRPRPDTRRLAKLLGMLGSPHEGEVASALAHVLAEHKRLGLTWQELLGW